MSHNVPGPGAELLMGTLLAALLTGDGDTGQWACQLGPQLGEDYAEQNIYSHSSSPAMCPVSCVLTLLLNYPPNYVG